jgi:hypothetical protein
MASKDLKELVAREIASGETIADAARRHGYTWKGMKKLVETGEMQQLVEAERQQIREAAERCRAQLLQVTPKAVENVAAVLGNPRHPKQLETSRWVIDKVLPGRTTVEAEVSVGPSARDAQLQAELDAVFVQISKSLQQLSEAQAGQPGFLSRVRTGPDALPRAALPAGGGDR